MNRSATLLLALVVAASFLLSPTLGTGSGAPGAAASPIAVASAPAPLHPHPSITCPPPPYPIYEPQNGVWPLSPSQKNQGTCGYIGPDEVHAAFFSSQPGSGERFSIPVNLPVDGSQPQANAYAQFWVGMVVKGDHFSEWGQSYAEVVFVPSGSGSGLSYTTSLHVFSLLNAAVYSGGICPYTNFTWNSSFYCETDEYNPSGNATSSGSIPSGDHLTVTFSGDPKSTTGLAVWVNDSTHSADSLDYLLNSTNSGSYTFEPYFNASCPDFCLLNWSMNVGLGIGFSLCPMGSSSFSVCDSYNSTIWQGTHPPEFGIPAFYSGGGYYGDYYYFAPASDSGVCNYVTGLTSDCYNNAYNGGNGFYPWFTYNGSQLDFGSNWTWTTQDWGGPSVELLSSGNLHDLVPFYFYRTTNDSREGFVGPGAAVNVTAWIQDLGAIASAYLNYQVNGGPVTSIAMTRQAIGGLPNSANFSAEIPSGVNGWINFTLNATNRAGAVIVQPYSGAYHIQRGPLPTFKVGVAIPFPACASASVNGLTYANNTTVLIQPGDYPLVGRSCYPYTFQRWAVTRGLTVGSPFALSTDLGVSSSGSLAASWQYVRPFDQLTVHTNPSTCGQVVLNGSYLSDGSGISLLDQSNYTLSFLGCSGKSFAGWTFTGNLSILGGSNSAYNLEPFSNGTLTANFVTTTSGNSVIFYTNPSNCGGVALSGAGYTSGTALTLASGSYPIAPDPCFHYGFRSPWVTTGGLSVSGSTLTVTNGGTITENYYVLTMVNVVISGCGRGYWDASRVTYDEMVVVANNSTHVVTGTPCAGWYLFAISGGGGVSVVGNVATVNASGTVYFTFIQGTPSQVVAFLTDPADCGAILFNGAPFENSNFTYVAPGTVASVSASPCPGYGFLGWVTYGGISIVGNEAWLNGSGAIQAVFQPLATLYVYTSPSTCGSVEVANVSYPSGGILTLTEFRQYTLVAVPCAGYGFSSWVNSSGAQLPGGTTLGAQTVFLSSAAVLTAVFTPVVYQVVVSVTPSSCGGIRVAGQTVRNGTVLPLTGGTYAISAAPCAGEHLVRWTASSNLSVANTTLWVNGSGTVGAFYQPVLPTLSISVPTSAFSGISVLLGVTVAVPVPPYNYSYAWSFGDGGQLTTPVNFTSHTYASPGSYVVTVTVTDPYGRIANASGTLDIVAPTATATASLPPTTLAALGAAVLAVLAVLVIGARVRRHAPSSREDGGVGYAAPAAEPAETPAPEPGTEPRESESEQAKP